MIKIELKKLFCRNNILSIIVFLALIIFISINIISNLPPYLNDKGNLTEGISALRERSREEIKMSGYLDRIGLNNWNEHYKNSVQKVLYTENTSSFIRNGYSTKFETVNLLINFTKKVEKTNDSDIDLELEKDYLNDFYHKWSKAAFKYGEIYNGYGPQLEEKVNSLYDTLEFPFYYEGIGLYSLFLALYDQQYILIIILSMILVSNLYTKKSTTGIDELALVSKYGKSELIKKKYIAGVLITSIVYTVYFIILLLGVIGLTGSFLGLNTSLQLYAYACPFNLTVKQAIALIYLMGLFGILVVTQMIQFISILLKQQIATIFVGAGILYFFNRYILVSDIDFIEAYKLFLIRLIPIRYINTMDLFYGAVHYSINGCLVSYPKIIGGFFLVSSVLMYFLTSVLGKRYYMG